MNLFCIHRSIFASPASSYLYSTAERENSSKAERENIPCTAMSRPLFGLTREPFDLLSSVQVVNFYVLTRKKCAV